MRNTFQNFDKLCKFSTHLSILVASSTYRHRFIYDIKSTVFINTYVHICISTASSECLTESSFIFLSAHTRGLITNRPFDSLELRVTYSYPFPESPIHRFRNYWSLYTKHQSNWTYKLFSATKSALFPFIC